jgi:hypothetical protein
MLFYLTPITKNLKSEIRQKFKLRISFCIIRKSRSKCIIISLFSLPLKRLYRGGDITQDYLSIKRGKNRERKAKERKKYQRDANV